MLELNWDPFVLFVIYITDQNGSFFIKKILSINFYINYEINFETNIRSISVIYYFKHML